MALERCPECDGAAVHYGSNPLHRALRAVFGTRRRYCPDCGHRWHTPGMPRALRLQAAAASLALAVLALAACFSIAATPWGRSHEIPTPRSMAALFGRMIHPDPYSVRSWIFGGPSASPGPEQLRPLSGIPIAERPPGTHAGFSPQQTAPNEFNLAGMLKDSGSLLKMMMKGEDQQAMMADADHLSKKDLWEKYGHYFQSKDQAKTAYGQYQEKKKSGQLDPKAAPEPMPEPEPKQE